MKHIQACTDDDMAYALAAAFFRQHFIIMPFTLFMRSHGLLDILRLGLFYEQALYRLDRGMQSLGLTVQLQHHVAN